MTEPPTQAVLPGTDLHLLRPTIADDEFQVSVAVLRREVAPELIAAISSTG